LVVGVRDRDSGARGVGGGQPDREGKPVLVLFDEVPGCATVRAYGAGTLSDPLVVSRTDHEPARARGAGVSWRPARHAIQPPS